MSLLRVILTQNCFTFQQTIYQPNQGITMGSPISSLIAEIFLQQYEDKNIKHLLDTKNIAYYARYVDDILIIFDTTKISLHTITRYINNIHSNIKLNTTYEQHSSIDFLDLITHQHKKLEIDIQKAIDHGHNNRLPFKPPHRTKKGSLWISPYQNALPSTRSKKETKGMEDNTNNSTKQQHTTTTAPKTQSTGTAENRPKP